MRGIVMLGLTLALALSMAPKAAGQTQGKVPQDLLRLAIQAGRFAGSAAYCRADEDKIDRFVSRVRGRLAAGASDDIEKALLNVEFKNQMTAASVKAPEAGCDAFLQEFDRFLGEL